MNIEQTSKNIFMYIKTHYGETILAKIRKLEKTMIKYSSYTNHLQPDDGRSISRNVAHLNILVHDMINLLYYEY